MSDYFFTTLTNTQKQQLNQLVQSCQEEEPITLGIPEDGSFYLLTCSEQNFPISCLIVCEVQDDRWECYAFTHPAHRKKGLFSRLFCWVCQLAEKREHELAAACIDLVFLTDEKSPAALAAAKALQINYWYSEYQMQWQKNIPLPDCPIPDLILRKKSIKEEGSDAWLYLAFPAAADPKTQKIHQTTSSPLGRCCLLPCSPLRFYFYRLEIKKEMRGRGWGEKLLHAVLAELPLNSTVTLQVSSDNLPAVNLYKKTGFQRIETLSYFLF